MDITYFMKIQNAYGTKNRQEKELNKVNYEMSKHFGDTFGTEEILLNGVPTHLMILKDTDGNTFKKKIKSVHGCKLNLGDYVAWNNQIWLITLIDADEKTWNRGYMYLCTVPLRWQNSEGKVIERWGYCEDFTKYSNGVIGNNTITVGDNQYGLTLPVDSETKKLKRGMRFPMDFDDSEQPDIYKLTNRKVKLSDNQYFGRGGTMVVTMSFDFFHPNDDKKITMENGWEVWICDYNHSSASPLPCPPVPDEMTDLRAVISGEKELPISYASTYTVTFMDKNIGRNIQWKDVNFSWNIVSNFENEIEQNVSGNRIELLIENEDCADEKFRLQVLIGETVLTEMIIFVENIM